MESREYNCKENEKGSLNCPLTKMIRIQTKREKVLTFNTYIQARRE
jgi:hypothetical protein